MTFVQVWEGAQKSENIRERRWTYELIDERIGLSGQKEHIIVF